MQKKLGNDCENKFCKHLFLNGYWVYLFPYKKNGQPCDVIAVKNDKVILVDVKHCEGDYFNISRIEPNQRSTFELAKERGVKNVGFAIYYEKSQKFYWLPYADKMNRTYKENELKLFDEFFNW